MSQLELLNACTYMYFNLDRKLFQTDEFKDEIKELFEKHWFFEKINQLTVKNTADIYNLNSYVSYIKNKDLDLFNRLFHYPLKRTGNSEVMLFLLFENAYLSNSGASGNDIIINNIEYEIKNCIVSKKYKSDSLYFSNFKLGNAFCVRNIINNIENYFNKIPKGSEIAEARKDSDFLRLEEEYRNVVYNEYFNKHDMIFIDKYGEIRFVGKVLKENIFIDTITEGTIKPMILI